MAESFWSFLTRKPAQASSTKANEARQIISVQSLGQSKSSPRDYESFSREGYQANAIVFTAVSRIASKCSTIRMKLFKNQGSGRTEVATHPILDLLSRPNPVQGYRDLVSEWVSYKKLHGNAFIQAVNRKRAEQLPAELWVLRPDRVKIKPGNFGLPGAYIFKVGSNERVFPVDIRKGFSNILHTKCFHPLNDWYGMSPIEAAAYAVDQHNKANIWNNSLLDNNAVPSGALSTKDNMSEDEYNEAQKQLDESHTGARNIKRPMILSGGLEWKPFSFSPQEMDFLEGKNVNSKDVALALNFPPMLLGIKGDSTFNNYEAAKLALVEESCIPETEKFAEDINRWILHPHDPSLELEPCVDEIPEIRAKQLATQERVDKIASFSVNEKREKMGMDTRSDEIHDEILVDAGKIPISDLSLELDGLDESESELLDDNDEKDSRGRDVETKGLNLKTVRQKRAHHRSLLRKRAKSERRLAAQISTFFMKEAKGLSKELEGVENVDEAISRSKKFIGENSSGLMVPLSKNVEKILTDFGRAVFDGVKSINQIERKNSTVRFEDFVRRYVEANAGKNIGLIEETSRKRVLREIREIFSAHVLDSDSELELGKKLEEVYRDFAPVRSRLIARTETNVASNEGSRAAAKALQIPNLKKEWVTASDGRVRDGKSGDWLELECKSSANHKKMNGVKVPLDSKFEVPGKDGVDLLEGPGDQNAPVYQLANCRCITIYQESE